MFMHDADALERNAVVLTFDDGDPAYFGSPIPNITEVYLEGLRERQRLARSLAQKQADNV